ncbi:MAG: T9SS type A sorting domain-containing protein [Bacteroidetes bacterium]|nr:T9SS type A sorting domain-containing protein [Bacteroidota bacterium]
MKYGFLISVLLVLIFPLTSSAQQRMCGTALFRMYLSSNSASQNWCGTNKVMVPLNEQGVSDLARVQKYINAIKASDSRTNDTIYIPTVVHIFHYNGFGNISDEQVKDGLRVVNEDFNRRNADSSSTRDIFKPFAASIPWKFVLAKLDSNGNPTTGITRYDTVLIPHPEPTDSNFDNIKKVSHWPPDMYYNIWIVRAIAGGTIGYAQYPGTGFTYGGPWKTWGIVVNYRYWGTIESSNDDGRTGTHEIGHSFGLYHTFQGSKTNCPTRCDTSGDFVCDTPPCKSSSGCVQTKNTCNTDTMGPAPYVVDSVDQLENYMSYNNCQNMFSKDQQDRMQGYMDAFQNIQDLISPANLVATGIVWAAGIPVAEQIPEILIHPNPASRSVNISISLLGEQAVVMLIDLMGKVIVAQKVDRGGDASLDTSQLPSGIYFVRVVSESILETKKLVVQN